MSTSLPPAESSGSLRERVRSLKLDPVTPAPAATSNRPATATPQAAATKTASAQAGTGMGRVAPGRGGGVLLVLCILLGLLVISLAAGLGWLVWLSQVAEQKATTQQERIKQLEDAQAALALKKAGPKPGEIVLESKGYIIPEQQILVSPQVSGRVLQLYVAEGIRVEKGAVLAVLDSTEYQSTYNRAVAAVARAEETLAELREGSRPGEILEAEASLSEAATLLSQSLRVYERKEDLMERKIIPREELDEALSAYEANVKRVERLKATLALIREGPRVERKRVAEAEVRQAQADLMKAKWQLDNTIIRAPITGTILKKNAELGNLVNPIAFNGSFSLCDLADLSRLEVELTIDERDLSKVYAGQRCSVRTEAWPDRIYVGRVSRLLPIADRAKGALPVRVEVVVPAGEEGQFLKPEMSALVVFYNDPPRGEISNLPVSRRTLELTPMPTDTPAPSEFLAPDTAIPAPTTLPPSTPAQPPSAEPATTGN